MDWLWTWGGACFGYRDGDDLWTRDGRHVGRFAGREIYARTGVYLGELMGDHRLTVCHARANRLHVSFLPHAGSAAPAAGHAVPAPRAAYALLAGYWDFPAPEAVR